MNFSDRITFITQAESYYDATTGEYVDAELEAYDLPCKLSPMSLTRSTEVFGNVSENITIARLLRPYRQKFDSVLVKDKKYKVLKESNYNKGVLFLQGDSYE